MSKRIVSGIYLIRNTVNGKVYVGSGVHVAKRWITHRYHLNKGTHHCEYLQRAWIKYGAGVFDLEIIEPVERNEDLKSREQAHLDAAFASGLAYNLCRTAGSILGVIRAAATKAKISRANKGRRGYTPSAETRALLSLAGTGRPVSAETRDRISVGNRGKPKSEAHRKAMSLGMTGKKRGPMPEAQRRAISLGNIGKPKSDAHRKAMSLANGKRRGMTWRINEHGKRVWMKRPIL